LGIWALGFVSLLMDLSSELIHSLLPVFMVTVLGASMLTVGLIEGGAEATALVIKAFAGTLSDWWGKRKPLTVMGYAIGALCKPLFAIASTVDMVVTARVLDRVGKGIRGAPRDALIADMVPPAMRGAAFGLRQSIDTVGAFLGPMLGIALMLLWANDFQAVFWVAVIPAGLCVLLLIFGVQEPERAASAPRMGISIRENWRSLESHYWWVVALGTLFTLARFSEAFLVLRAQQDGLALAWTPAVLIVMNLVYAALAYPFGKLSDRIEPHMLLGGGLLVLIGANLLLAQGGWAIWPGIALWGMQMAITQGLMSAMVAASAPAALRGTAFGIFNLVSGLALIVASGLAGFLWDRLGAPATFMASAGISTLAFLAIWWMRPLLRR
jgi:MFS family permease